MFIAERKTVQDKLILLNGKELDEVDAFIEELFARRRKIADNIRERE
jgi:hypothetical protein